MEHGSEKGGGGGKEAGRQNELEGGPVKNSSWPPGYSAARRKYLTGTAVPRLLKYDKVGTLNTYKVGIHTQI